MSISIQAEPGQQAVAGFLEIGLDELVERDRFQQPIARWLAVDGDEPAGLATAFVRADDRLFVNHRINSEDLFGPLLDAAIRQLDRPVHISVLDTDEHRLRLAERSGFVVELTARAFDVPFQPVVAMTASRQSSTVDYVQADSVSPDQLFALDTELRCDVPGNDGWRGNRLWFDDEMNSPEFEPSAYVVARDRRSGTLVGLCRIWKNRDGAALGMLGVLPTHRTGWPALGLLHRAALAAEKWGFETFSAHTARAPLQRRLRQIGAVETGGFTRLRLDPA
jgi:hypothetical protein